MIEGGLCSPSSGTGTLLSGQGFGMMRPWSLFVVPVRHNTGLKFLRIFSKSGVRLQGGTIIIDTTLQTRFMKP